MYDMVPYLCVYSTLLPMILVSFVFYGRLLTPRWPRFLLLVQVLVLVQMVLVVPEDHTRLTSGFVGLMPLIFYMEDLRYRLLICSVLLTTVKAAEMTSVSLWMLLTGGASSQSVAASWAHYPEHLISALFATAVMALLLWAFERQIGVVREYLGARVMSIVGLLAAQSAMLYALGNSIMRDSPADAPLFWLASVLCLLCVAADIGVFRVAGRLRAREEELRRAHELSAVVDELARRASLEMEAEAETAMLRHDARNHVQVLRSLIEGGDEGEARDYARSLAAAWDLGEKGRR